MNIEEKRQRIKELVDKMNYEQLEKYHKQIFADSLEEEYLTEEEIKKLDQVIEESEQEKLYSFDEVFGDLDV
jgi:predicted transcriptional regulator